ncbi:DUF2089 domain-containing protein [Aneurinibacillus sp. Ricciae_BoGa-3]|uniref:DUF2089 domain-containing protein n=1 Tax=Aneurinibacillus sp. Ricciae_BoGa-3 TaxID=3022697 RepID=UPI002341CA86|nr:DUF2089 domain-containing protein [Aneurinibacillus sp. Ricciae_BoGa-3]WCK55211.1 DUF2089 domain-containing protein [Aneurinibacillus sp. Ricciae_BoGa-3]
MPYSVLTNCPVCSHSLHVTKLQCPHCQTTIENTFTLSKIGSLSAEQLQFVETFLICRGNIKEVEKELGISYPTVRGKLNEIVSALTDDKSTPKRPQRDAKKVVSLLENGDITAEEAIQLLKDV